jgi:hypothetical protein
MTKGTVRALSALGVLLLTVLALGGTSASAQRASSTYRCAYGKTFKPLGTVYWSMTVSPKNVGSLFCRSFNGGFRGRRYASGQKLGTGQAYCRFALKKPGYSIVGVVFADKKSTGRAFCKIYHPAGWKRS